MRFHLFVKIGMSFFMLTIIQFTYVIQSKGKYDYVQGVIDRIIDDDLVVILVEDASEQITLPLRELPNDSKEGMILKMRVSNEDYVVLTIDDEKTECQYKENKRVYKQLKDKKTITD